jgi:DnaK suppressor protein
MSAKKTKPKSPTKLKKSPPAKAVAKSSVKSAVKKSTASKKPAAPVAARPTPAPAPAPAPAKPRAKGPVTKEVIAEGVRRAPLPVRDDADGDSLLAGPRNVQPYVTKRGEQYMSKDQLEHFRNILQDWKQDLMLEVDRTVSHMKDEAANFPDPNDRATQEEEFSLELRTRDRERKLIRKIDEALKRIEDGSYGYCLETGEQIGIKRLEARPVATLSLEAQERRERREKQYGDRDDRYR